MPLAKLKQFPRSEARVMTHPEADRMMHRTEVSRRAIVRERHPTNQKLRGLASEAPVPNLEHLAD